MSKITFLPYAKQELDDATRFYEMEFKGLGLSFRDEVKKAVMRIAEYPKAWPLERGDIRKCMLHKFSYNLNNSPKEEKKCVQGRETFPFLSFPCLTRESIVGAGVCMDAGSSPA